MVDEQAKRGQILMEVFSEIQYWWL